MKAGIQNAFATGNFSLPSPPKVFKSVVITGARVQESPSFGFAGDTRAWDAHTSKLVWQFHSVAQPGDTGGDTRKGDAWKGRSGTNVWGLISPELGPVYLPYGSLESPPVLFDVTRNKTKIPALAVTSKTGLVFILDRRTGKPVYDVEERAVPQSEMPGEHSSSGTTRAHIPPNTSATQYSYGRRRWGGRCAALDISSAIPIGFWSGRTENPVGRSRSTKS
jgi:glucose dehydrogenase